MKFLALSMLPLALSAEPSGLRAIGTTQPQIVARYTAPSSAACTIEVRDGATLALVHDTNNSIFADSQNDLARPSTIVAGLDRTIIIGERTIAADANGINRSRALQIDWPHTLQVDCGGTALINVRTAGMVFGRTHRASLQHDAVTGLPVWSELGWTNRNEVVIDPLTGVAISRLSMPGDLKKMLGYSGVAGCYNTSGTPWTNTGSGTCSTQMVHDAASQEWLFIQAGNYGSSGYFTGDELASNQVRMHFVALQIQAQLIAGSDGTIEACITFNGRAAVPTCFSPIQEIVATGTETCKEIASSLGSGKGNCGSITLTYGNFWGGSYRDGFSSRMSTGLVFNAGSSTTISFTQAADCTALNAHATEGSVLTLPSGTQITVTATNCGSLTATVASAINLTPPGTAAGFPFITRTGWGDNYGAGWLIRKKDTASTIGIRTPQFKWGLTSAVLGTSSGLHHMASTVADSGGWVKARFGERIIALNTNTWEARYLGVFTTQFGDAGGILATTAACVQAGYGSTFWDRVDPNVFYCSTLDTGGKVRFVKVTLTGDAANNVEQIPTEGTQQYNQVSRTVVDLLGDELVDRLVVDFPSFPVSTFGEGCGLDGISGDRYAMFTCRRQGPSGAHQDAAAWIVVYDLGNKLPLGSGGNGSFVGATPSYKNGRTRWGVHHASFDPEDTTSLVAWNTTLTKTEPIICTGDSGNCFVGNESQQVDYDAFCSANCEGGSPTWTVGTAPEQPTVRVRLVSSWTGMAATCGTEPAAFESGDPIYKGPALLGQVQEDCYWDKIAVGDVMAWRVNMGDGGEAWRIDTIHGQSAAGLDVTVTRNYIPNIKICAAAYCTVTVGSTFNMYTDQSINGIMVVWDFLASPDGSSLSSQYLAILPGGGHQQIGNYYSVGAPDFQSQVSAVGIQADRSVFPFTAANAEQVFALAQPGFAGVIPFWAGVMWEAHPGFTYRPNHKRQRATDAHPFAGTLNNYPYTPTHIAGTLWRVVLTGGSNEQLKRKIFPTKINSGMRGFQDISSAATGDQITGNVADAYKYCVALAVNECRTGSSVGDIYVNAPSVDPSNLTCGANAFTPHDFCVLNWAARGDAVVLYEMPEKDNITASQALIKNREDFTLVEGFYGQHKGHNNTWSAKSVGEKWAMIYNTGPLVPSIAPPPYRTDAVVARIPEMGSRDTINRATFIPIPVKLGSVPPTTDTVRVDFGYQEYGTASQFYCTSRREACVAVGASVNEATPFYWESETYTRLSCSSGCTPVIPAISGRVLFYRVKYYNSGGTQISSGLTEVVAVP